MSITWNGNSFVFFGRRGEGPDAIKNANLFVGNLPLAWKEGDLERAFKQHGSVIKCKVLIDQLTGVSRGCGFVLFSKTAEADNAIKGERRTHESFLRAIFAKAVSDEQIYKWTWAKTEQKKNSQ